MAHTVFICHSSKDKLVADAACAALEAQRIPCWIAPRDVLGGTEYMEELDEALANSQIVLLIFSQKANDSPQVRREIERSVSYEKIILPFRIEDALPTRAMKFALSNTHWLDAITPPMEKRLSDLCDTVARLMQRRSVTASLLKPIETMPEEAKAVIPEPILERSLMKPEPVAEDTITMSKPVSKTVADEARSTTESISKLIPALTSKTTPSPEKTARVIHEASGTVSAPRPETVKNHSIGKEAVKSLMFRVQRRRWAFTAGIALILLFAIWVFFIRSTIPPLSSDKPRLLESNEDAIASIAYSPDGLTLAAGAGGDILLFNVANGQVSRTLKGHTKDVMSVVFSPDGHTLVSGSFDTTIRLWNVASGQMLFTLTGQNRAVFTPDGRTVVAVNDNKTINFFDVASGQLVRTLQDTDEVDFVAASPDGRILASGGNKGEVKLWDIAGGRISRILQGQGEAIWSIVFSPDGRILAAGGGDHTVKLWDVGGGQLLHTLQGHPDPVYSVVFSPDGFTLASQSFDETINLWDLADGHILRTQAGKHSDYVWATAVLAFSPDGHTLASGIGDNFVKLWNLSSK